MRQNSNNDDEVLSHPIIAHQLMYAKTVLQHGSAVVEDILKIRPNLSRVVAVDVVIKLFRDSVCSTIECVSCARCIPSTFMDEIKFKQFLSKSKHTILDKVQQWFNNSFNVPQRWMCIQYVVDKMIPPRDAVVFLEIWCAGWLIGRVLTNSNHAKNYFERPPFGWKLTPDSRHTYYCWVDPNVVESEKEMLMMINGDTPEMQLWRDTLREVLADPEFSNDRICLKKWTLEKEAFLEIMNMVKRWVKEEKTCVGIHFVLITSVMRYYFQDINSNKQFEREILEFSETIESEWIFNTISYISSEVYGKDGWIYPSQAADYSKLMTRFQGIRGWDFIEVVDFPELTCQY